LEFPRQVVRGLLLRRLLVILVDVVEQHGFFLFVPGVVLRVVHHVPSGAHGHAAAAHGEEFEAVGPLDVDVGVHLNRVVEVVLGPLVEVAPVVDVFVLVLPILVHVLHRLLLVHVLLLRVILLLLLLLLG
jgi:hypothetical protein